MNSLPLLMKAVTTTTMNENASSSAVCQEVSLQESFRKFRDMKIRAKTLLKHAKNGEFNGSNERTASFKNDLRQKFISAAKSYIGVPYAERYKEENEPVAFLYLDCCALVRRAVTDLQDDFGIVLGRWNQAYQMDTLPIILSQSELKPGDLIFYEGLYVSKRSKIQKHNTVHVEIFLGGETGEATIGARFQKGTVSIFPSYKFTSKTWTLVQYHFRSLDTWLNGECRSHCKEHLWHSDALVIKAVMRNSIFKCESDDESAGGDAEGSFEDSSRVLQDIVEVPSILTAEHVIDGKSEVNLDNKLFGCEILNSIQCNTGTGRHNRQSTLPSATHSEADVIFPVLPVSRSVRIAVGSTVAVTHRKSGTAGEGLETISGSAVLLQRRCQSLTDGKRVESDRHFCSTSSSVSKHVKRQPNHTYYVGKSNGWRLIKNSMDRRGWKQLPFEYSFSSKFTLKWVERRSQIDYRAHTPGQLVNHIPNNDCITTKIELLNTLREKYCQPVLDSTERVSTPWVPETYNLDSGADIIELLQVENQAYLLKIKASPDAKIAVNFNDSSDSIEGQSHEEIMKNSNISKDNDKQKNGTKRANSPLADDNYGYLWIYKPSSSNRGRGIEVVRGAKELKLICHGRQTSDPATCISPRHGILQRYIENPLLVGTSGLKFDVRCYMLIACNDPFYTVYYHPGYCRLALKRYCTTAESLLDPMVHLTNASVQKKDPNYDKDSQVSFMSAGNYIISIFYLNMP